MVQHSHATVFFFDFTPQPQSDWQFRGFSGGKWQVECHGTGTSLGDPIEAPKKGKMQHFLGVKFEWKKNETKPLFRCMMSWDGDLVCVSILIELSNWKLLVSITSCKTNIFRVHHFFCSNVHFDSNLFYHGASRFFSSLAIRPCNLRSVLLEELCAFEKIPCCWWLAKPTLPDPGNGCQVESRVIF